MERCCESRRPSRQDQCHGASGRVRPQQAPDSANRQESHDESASSFVAYLLARNIRYEEDLDDQLFNSSEKRLARIRSFYCSRVLARKENPGRWFPKISQKILAEMIGTTRSRVSFFMNRFRKLGFIEYNG
jgi:CRP-like cAMP-binding protein